MALSVRKAERIRFDTILRESIVHSSRARANERVNSYGSLIVRISLVSVGFDFRVDFLAFHESISVEMTFLRSPH